MKEEHSPHPSPYWRGRKDKIFGAVAQLGERLVRNEKVGGSTPLCSILLLIPQININRNSSKNKR